MRKPYVYLSNLFYFKSNYINYRKKRERYSSASVASKVKVIVSLEMDWIDTAFIMLVAFIDIGIAIALISKLTTAV